MKLIAERGAYKIYRDSSTESGDAFYTRMGKQFASREVFKALEEPMFDTADHVWLLVYAGNELAAFACIDGGQMRKKCIAVLTYAYVMPAHRQHGLHGILFELRLSLAINMGAKMIRGVANGNSNSKFISHGFRSTRQNGRFTYYEKEIL